MNEKPTPLLAVSELAVPLERDMFLRSLLRHLGGTLEKVVGLEEASGFISIVGQEMGDEFNELYQKGATVTKLDREQVADVILFDIRHQPWGKNMLLIAVTGWGQAEDRRLSREAGFDHHLVKPVDLDALMRLLERLKLAEQ